MKSELKARVHTRLSNFSVQRMLNFTMGGQTDFGNELEAELALADASLSFAPPVAAFVAPAAIKALEDRDKPGWSPNCKSVQKSRNNAGPL